MMSALIALALTAAGPGAQPSPSGPDAITWLCERKWSAPGVSVIVARYLATSGRQREMYVEWNVAGSGGLRFEGFAGSDQEAGDVSLSNWNAWLGWSRKVLDAQGFDSTQIILGRREEGQLPPNASRPGTFSPDISMVWDEFRHYARGGKVEASLVDERGHVRASGAVEISQILAGRDRAALEISAGQADVRRYRSRCRHIDLSITVN